MATALGEQCGGNCSRRTSAQTERRQSPRGRRRASAQGNGGRGTEPRCLHVFIPPVAGSIGTGVLRCRRLGDEHLIAEYKDVVSL